MKTILLLFIILIAISIPPIYAHKVLSVNQDNTMFQTATLIPNTQTAYLTLEKFEREGQSHWYTFRGFAGQEVLISTLVPDIPSSSDFTPCFDLLIGQDKFTPQVDRRRFFEDFTQTNWIQTCELRMTLPSSGQYFIRAHDELHNYHIGDTGKFSLASGQVDDFTIFDWFQVPFWLLHLHLFFENTVFVAIMLTLLVIFTVIILIAIKNRRE